MANRTKMPRPVMTNSDVLMCTASPAAGFVIVAQTMPLKW